MPCEKPPKAVTVLLYAFARLFRSYLKE